VVEDAFAQKPLDEATAIVVISKLLLPVTIPYKIVLFRTSYEPWHAGSSSSLLPALVYTASASSL